ncbi:hypothetical protein [Veillonella sp.]|uniref:hypothetical protein n=1 Tax=Veillonella sp. TaxID=1926307 RepID=UPI001B548EB7|nr:hypothetical protein [Veillonella sp.]MBP8616058.1 hypothetical protein [Veillonella sp.]MBP9516896.1 hypothetical protein [Veillonella sp.]
MTTLNHFSDVLKSQMLLCLVRMEIYQGKYVPLPTDCFFNILITVVRSTGPKSKNFKTALIATMNINDEIYC